MGESFMLNYLFNNKIIVKSFKDCSISNAFEHTGDDHLLEEDSASDIR